MKNIALNNEEANVVLSVLQYAIDNGYYDDVIDYDAFESALQKLQNAVNEAD